MQHGVSKLEEQGNNLPPYRWYGECLCGFATRQATEALVESQLNAHLAIYGIVAPVHVAAPPVPAASDSGKPKGTWVPLGAKKGG